MKIELLLFLHIQFTRFQTRSLQSPGTYISERTWNVFGVPVKKLFENSKIVEEQLDVLIFRWFVQVFDWETFINKQKRVKTVDILT